jgi:hypothetical protein
MLQYIACYDCEVNVTVSFCSFRKYEEKLFFEWQGSVSFQLNDCTPQKMLLFTAVEIATHSFVYRVIKIVNCYFANQLGGGGQHKSYPRNKFDFSYIIFTRAAYKNKWCIIFCMSVFDYFWHGKFVNNLKPQLLYITLCSNTQVATNNLLHQYCLI